MHTHTCRPLPDHTTTIEVQDGWEGPPFVPDGTYTRRPVMRLRTTQWGPVVWHGDHVSSSRGQRGLRVTGGECHRCAPRVPALAAKATRPGVSSARGPRHPAPALRRPRRRAAAH